MSAAAQPSTRPFLKWTGGKQWLMPFFANAVPRPTGTYWEPFVGGGAAYFALRPESAILSDTNVDLIETYRSVRDHVEDVIRELADYPYDRAFFDEIRRRRPDGSVASAARFIYLNKTAFNGIYRVNQKGEFNVPFGTFVRPGICQPERLRAASVALTNAELRVGDFATTLADCQEGDMVYLDPPYITGHQNNGFVRYNEHLFSWADQTRLAGLAADLVARGVAVLVTNASHEAISKLYAEFFKYSVTRNSLIAGPIAKRSRATEFVFSSQQLRGMEPDAN